MANKFTQLRSHMSPDSQARSEARAQEMLAEMPLNELRQARGLSQKMLADVLHVQQPSIAKMEKRTDMYLSTLRSHIEAMGGQLEASLASRMARSKSATSAILAPSPDPRYGNGASYIDLTPVDLTPVGH